MQQRFFPQHFSDRFRRERPARLRPVGPRLRQIRLLRQTRRQAAAGKFIYRLIFPYNG
jgi:hypothetical protein